MASATENSPGELTGQPFEVDQYDNDASDAAGTAWWDATGAGGVHVGRGDLAMPYSSAFWADRLASGQVARSGSPRNGVHAVRR